MAFNNDGELESTSALQTKLAVGVIGTIAASLWIVYLLMQIEISNKSKTIETAQESQQHGSSTNDLQLENDEESSAQKCETTHKNARRRVLRWEQKGLLLLTVGVLVLLDYLLLVYLPSGAVWINLVAVVAVTVAFLRCQIADEIRRSRFDRLLGIVTLFVFVASFLSVATYARLALQEGQIYAGAARIVGYDDTTYNNDKNQRDTTTRTDLEVAWGGSWGCPETESFCQAFVNGAMCESKNDEDDNGGDRFLEDANDGNDGDNNDADDGNDGDNNGADNNDANNNDADNNDADNNDADNNNDNDADNEKQDEEAEENEDLEEEVQEEEEENEELEEENEELEEELDEEEEVVEEEYEELWYYDDDYFEDDYWNYDWDSVWGDYACEDLFETDLEGEQYDEDSPPGNDDWPYVMIYGSCKSCKAYFMDYYSTEHFGSIQQYQTEGRIYALAGGICLMITLVFAIKQKMAPAKEHEVELLTNDGGVVA